MLYSHGHGRGARVGTHKSRKQLDMRVRVSSASLAHPKTICHGARASSSQDTARRNSGWKATYRKVTEMPIHKKISISNITHISCKHRKSPEINSDRKATCRRVTGNIHLQNIKISKYWVKCQDIIQTSQHYVGSSLSLNL